MSSGKYEGLHDYTEEEIAKFQRAKEVKEMLEKEKDQWANRQYKEDGRLDLQLKTKDGVREAKEMLETKDRDGNPIVVPEVERISLNREKAAGWPVWGKHEGWPPPLRNWAERAFAQPCANEKEKMNIMKNLAAVSESKSKQRTQQHTCSPTSLTAHTPLTFPPFPPFPPSVPDHRQEVQGQVDLYRGLGQLPFT